MGRYCIICKSTNRSTHTHKISLHAFPKDIIQRRKWFKFCQIDETKINSSTMLCNKHFKEEDFLHRVGDNKLILKKDAVPSVMKLSKCKKRLCQEMIDSLEHFDDANNTSMKLINKNSEVEFEYLDNNKVLNAPAKEDNNEEGITSFITEDCKIETKICQQLINIDSNKTSNKNNTNLMTEDLCIKRNIDNNKILNAPAKEDNNEEGITSFITEDCKIEPKICQQSINIDSNKTNNKNNTNLMTEDLCIKRNIDKTIRCTKTLRYFGDIKTCLITTPNQAKRALDVAARTISRYRKKIQTLQKASNRYRKKIKSLKDLVQQLRKKNLVTENAAEVLLTNNRNQ